MPSNPTAPASAVEMMTAEELTRMRSLGAWSSEQTARLFAAAAAYAPLVEENARLVRERDEARDCIAKAAFVETMHGPMKGADGWFRKGVEAGRAEEREAAEALLADSRAECEQLRADGEMVDLVKRFSAAMLEKMRGSEAKNGWNGYWKRDGWRDELLTEMHRHIAKGDPRDVAIYAAFAWHHGWSTALSNPREEEAKK